MRKFFCKRNKDAKITQTIKITGKFAVVFFCVCVGVGAVKFGWVFWSVALLIIHFYFIFSMLFKAYLSIISCQKHIIKWEFPTHLPKYSIIVPLYKEANMIPLIINSLTKLKYPKELLEIFITLEEDDKETIEAFQNIQKDDCFKLVIVPDSFPKTKPKACNYALKFATGKYTVIYDAEDIPENWQLIKAVSLFEKSKENVVCLQAALNYFNYKENIITRMFAIEYSYWFGFFIPGLSKKNIPMPLGGTSNHFKTDVLKKIGGWNPYNVTEDAEIGIRLAALGYDTLYLPSYTMEEAVSGIIPWIKQRTRWSKGYLQTWFFYIRSGTSLYKARGVKAAAVMSLFVLGTPLCALLTIPMYIFFFSSVLGFQWTQNLFPTLFFKNVAFFCLLFGNLIHIIFAWYATFRIGGKRLSLFSIFLPIYGILHSIAAWRALFQLFTSPYKWEKTQHGLSKNSFNDFDTK